MQNLFPKLFWVVSFYVILATATGATAGTSQVLFNITDLGIGGSTEDGAKGINASGQVAVTLNTYAYVWTNGVYSPAGGVNDGNGPLAINDLGHLAGAGGLRSFIYRNGSSTDLGVLEASGEDYTFADGINSNDTVVGQSYRQSKNSYRAFIWSNGTMTELSPSAPTGTDSNAAAINNAGQIAGSYGTYAARWDTSGNLTTMYPVTGDVSAAAYGLNASGTAVGTSNASYIFNTTATVWNGATPTALPAPSFSPDTQALGINDENQIVGFSGQFGNGYDAVMWQNGTVVDLDTVIPTNSGWSLEQAEAINDSGDIVGYGYYKGATHAFLLTPVPESRTGAIIIAGTIFVGKRRARSTGRAH